MKRRKNSTKRKEKKRRRDNDSRSFFPFCSAALVSVRRCAWMSEWVFAVNYTIKCSHHQHHRTIIVIALDSLCAWVERSECLWRTLHTAFRVSSSHYIHSLTHTHGQRNSHPSLGVVCAKMCVLSVDADISYREFNCQRDISLSVE